MEFNMNSNIKDNSFQNIGDGISSNTKMLSKFEHSKGVNDLKQINLSNVKIKCENLSKKKKLNEFNSGRLKLYDDLAKQSKHLEFFNSLIDYSTEDKSIKESAEEIEKELNEIEKGSQLTHCPLCLSGYLIINSEEVECTNRCYSFKSSILRLNELRLKDLVTLFNIFKLEHKDCKYSGKIFVSATPFNIICTDCLYK